MPDDLTPTLTEAGKPMGKRVTANLAKRIVDAIEQDIYDRAGLRQQWDQIDDSIVREIRKEWRRIIAAEIDRLERNRR